MHARVSRDFVQSRRRTRLIGWSLLISWGGYFLSLLPMDIASGIAGWLLPCLAVGGLVAGVLAIAERAYWIAIMRTSAALLLFVYVLLWSDYAVTLAEVRPDASFIALLVEVAKLKLQLIQATLNEGWLRLAKQVIWELTPGVQIVIVGYHYIETRRRKLSS